MAALDDEDTPETTGSSYAPTPTSALSAGDDSATVEAEAETGQDYGGGTDADTGTAARIPPSAIISMLQKNRSFQKLAPEMQQQIINMANKRSAVRDTSMPSGPEGVYAGTAAEPPAQDASLIPRALLRAKEDAAQSYAAMRGGTPEASTTPQADFETGISMDDLSSPGLLAKKLGFQLIRGGVAQLPAGMVGARLGAMGGAAVGGPAGAAIGGVFGMAATMGAAASFQDFGQVLLAETQKTPNDFDGAWERAKIEAVKSGAVTAASMGFFELPIIKPFVKSLFSNAVKDVTEAAPETLRSRLATQAVGQTAIPVAGQAGANVVEGKPITQDLPGAAASGIPNVALDILARGAGRFVTRGLRRGAEQPGIAADEAAALDATQEPHPASAAGPPVAGPDQMGPPATAMRGGQLLQRPPLPEDVPPIPPAGGIGGTPLPPEQVAAGPPMGPPRPSGVGGTPMGAEVAPAPTEAAGMAGPQRLVPERPPEQGPLQPPPEPPLPPTPPTGGGTEPPGPTPVIGPSRIQERFGVEPPVAPDVAAALTEPGPRSKIQERFGNPENWTTEPDDLHKGMFVAKDGPDGSVIGKGGSEKEALGDAHLRKGEPYPPEPGEVKGAAAVGGEAEAAAVPRETTLAEKPAEPTAAREPKAQREEAAPVRTRAEELKAVIAELDARNAPDTDYRAYLSTSGKSKQAGTTWRDKLVSLATSLGKADEVKAKVEAAKTEPAARAADLNMDITELRTILKRDFGEDAPLVNRSPRSKLEALYDKHVAEKEALTEQAQKAAAENPEFIAYLRDQERLAKENAARAVEGKPPLEATAPPVKPAETTRSHLDAWLDKTVAEADRSTVKNQIENLLKEQPDLVEKGRSWPEIRRLAESLAERRAEARTRSGAYTSGEGKEIPPVKQHPGTGRLTPAQIRAAQQTREARAEVRRQPQRVERGSGLSVEPTPEPIAGKELAKSSSIERVGRRIIQKLLGGEYGTDYRAALKAAREEYGVQKPVGQREGEAGRPRTNLTLAHAVRTALKEFDPNIDKAIRDQLAIVKKELETARGKAAVEGSVAQTELESKLAHEALIREHKGTLTKMLADLERIDTGGEPIGAPDIRGRRRLTDLIARGYAARAFSKLGPVNEPVLRLVDQSVSGSFRIDPTLGRVHASTGPGLHAYLDAVDNPALRRVMPHLSELVKILKDRLPDLKVEADDGTILARGEIAAYLPDADKIVFNPEKMRDPSNSAAVTIVHEALHAGTLDYIDKIFNTVEANLTPTELAHRNAMQSIVDEVRRINPTYFGELSTVESRALDYATKRYLSVEGPQELITQLFTDPAAMSVLTRERASQQLRNELNAAGMGPLRGIASVWDAFKGFVRKVFGIEYRMDSVFDHVMRPLGEIVEHGTRYREAGEFKSPAQHEAVLGAIAHNEQTLERPWNTRTENSLRVLKNLKTNWGDKIERGLLRAGFDGATLDAVHDFMKPVLPEITAHRRAIEAVANATREEYRREIATTGANGLPVVERNLDKTLRLQKAMRQLPDGEKLGRLMTEATMNDVRLGRGADNTHLATDAERTTLGKLQNEFAGLSPAAQQIYREVRDLHREWYRTERRAGLKSVVDYANPDLDQSSRQAIIDQLSTHQGVMDFINGPEQTAIAQKLGAKWENKKDLIHEIANLQRAGMVQGDYFPLRRYGEYVISYGKAIKPDPGKPYGVEMFETKAAADNRRAELMAAGRDDVSQVFNKAMGNQRKALVAHQALNTLDNAMIKAGLDENAQGALRDMYAGQLIQQGTRMATATMRREGIPGASIDQARNLMNDFLGYTSRLGHLEHGGEVINSLFRMEKQVHDLHLAGSKASAFDIASADLAVREMRLRQAPIDGDTSADTAGKGARKLTTMSFIYNLMRPAQQVIQLVDTHITASSIMGARHGVGAVGAVSRAMAELTGTTGRAILRNGMAAMRDELRTANWDLSEVYRARLEKVMNPDHANMLIDRLNAAGLIDYTKTRELRRMAGPEGWVGGAASKFGMLSKFLDTWSAGEHAMDSASRAAIAKAAFELEMAKSKGNVAAALDYAEQMARDTQPNYNSYNKSRIASGGQGYGRFIAPLMFQFKQYGLHMYGVQGNMLASAYLRNAAGSTERKEALAAIALLQGSHALLSGINTTIFGSLPMMVGLGLYDMLNPNDPSKGAHTNAQLDTSLRNWVYDTTGNKTVSEVFAKGWPAAFGIDAHHSTQFTNLMGVAELKTWDAQGADEFLTKTILGAPGETVVGMFAAARQMAHGDMTNARTFMPRTMRDLYDAYQLQYGVKNTKGDLTIVPPDKISGWDYPLKAVGFNPTDVTTPRDAKAAMKLEEDVSGARKSALVDKLVAAKDKPAEYRAALDEINRYNNVYRDDPISGQEIQHRFRDQARINATPGLYGLKVPRRDMTRVMQEGRFAGG